MDFDRRVLEMAINMLDEIVECNKKGYAYPFCLNKTKKIANNLISLLREGV